MAKKNLLNKLKFALFFFISATLLTYEFYLRSDIEVLIEEPTGPPTHIKMTRREAKNLDKFFREILIPDPLAYTLIGAKPLSFACYRKKSLFPRSSRIESGLKIWEKYEPQLSNSRIIFWKEGSPWVNGVCCLILADVEQCYRCIDENSKDFKEFLGEESLDVFKRVGQVPFFETILKKHDALIGILLGFGKKNAWLYNNSSPDVFLQKIWDPSFLKEASTYAKKYLLMQKINMTDLQVPRFVGEPYSSESQELIKRYLAARENIKSFYAERDFLSATLSLYKHGSRLLD